MSRGIGRWLWIAGAPVRAALLTLIRAYRVTLSGLAGGRCRFYPSCSSYAEQAIRNCGAVQGTALGVWRILRCSPLSRGGVDYPPARREAKRSGGPLYDNNIHGLGAGTRAGEATPA